MKSKLPGFQRAPWPRPSKAWLHFLAPMLTSMCTWNSSPVFCPQGLNAWALTAFLYRASNMYWSSVQKALFLLLQLPLKSAHSHLILTWTQQPWLGEVPTLCPINHWVSLFEDTYLYSQMYPRSMHFSPSPLPPSWSKTPFSLLEFCSLPLVLFASILGSLKVH